MSTIKSSAENLTLNADGSGNDIIFQSNASNVATLDQAGLLTATTFAGSGASLTALPAAQLTGSLPAISGASLTTLPTGSVLQVIYASISSAVTTSSGSYSDIGITASITPTSTSNHIYVEWFAPDNRKETGATNLGMRVYRQVDGGGYSSYTQVLGGWGWTNSRSWGES